jgi:hypothetical protein
MTLFKIIVEYYSMRALNLHINQHFLQVFFLCCVWPTDREAIYMITTGSGKWRWNSNSNNKQNTIRRREVGCCLCDIAQVSGYLLELLLLLWTKIPRYTAISRWRQAGNNTLVRQATVCKWLYLRSIVSIYDLMRQFAEIDPQDKEN